MTSGAVDPAIIQREKSGFAKLLGFAGAFIQTMQNWTDNTQSRLPGSRDRIAHVGLTPEEGGLNLNMPPERIEALTARGEAAATEFIARFGSPSEADQKMNWANHRWLRMRSWLSSLEVMLSRVNRTCAEPQPGDVDYEPGCGRRRREVARRATIGHRRPNTDWRSKRSARSGPDGRNGRPKNVPRPPVRHGPGRNCVRGPESNPLYVERIRLVPLGKETLPFAANL